MFVLTGLGFMALTLWSLRGGLVGRTSLAIVGFDAGSLSLGALAVLAAAVYYGPLFGLALVCSVAIHEFGHVAAYRVIGHHDARFRLVPLFGGFAISDRQPDTQAEDFFVSLLGPGISLAPMVLAYAASDAVAAWAPGLAGFLSTFAMLTAAINFFNLLPFWPLDGGRCVRSIAFTIHPNLAHAVTLAMSAALAAAGLMMQSILLFGFALLGAQSLMHADAAGRLQRRMTPMQTLIAAGAYLFTAAAHLAGGWVLLHRFF